MKKIITSLLTAALCFSMLVPAMAVDSEDNSVSTSEYYAYMDLETANLALKETILEARNQIIFSESWVADGINGYRTDPDGNIVCIQPQFSELFPSNWDMPSFSTTTVESETSMSPMATEEWGLVYNEILWLTTPLRVMSNQTCLSLSMVIYGYL